MLWVSVNYNRADELTKRNVFMYCELNMIMLTDLIGDESLENARNLKEKCEGDTYIEE